MHYIDPYMGPQFQKTGYQTEFAGLAYDSGDPRRPTSLLE